MSKARTLLLESHPFSEFDAATLSRFHDDANQRRFASGDVLFHEMSQSDEIYFIVEGTVRISMEFSSAHHMIEEIRGGAGELVGEGRFLAESPRPATVTAIDDVTALVWDVADWKKIADDNPAVGYRLAVYSGQVLFKRMEELRDQLINDMSWGIE